MLGAAQRYAHDGWTFVREPAGIDHAGEVVLSPCLTIQFNAGDCDDFAAMMAAIFKTIGVRSRIGWLPTGPGAAHILVAAQDGWYASNDSPYFIIDPNLKSPMNAARLNGVHWADV